MQCHAVQGGKFFVSEGQASSVLVWSFNFGLLLMILQRVFVLFAQAV